MDLAATSAAARERLVSLLLVTALGVPLMWAAWAAVVAGLDGAAWHALVADSQTARALGMTLWTGLAASALALALAAWLLSRTFPSPAWARLVRWLSPMLAMPHAAFAIGLAFLISPSGWLLRALSPWATGFTAPPPWPTPPAP